MLAEVLKIGLGRGILLLEVGLLLLQPRGFLLLGLKLLSPGSKLLLTGLKLLLLPGQCLAAPGQLAEQQFPAFLLVAQRQAHDGREVLAGLGLIGGHLHLELGWGALVHDFVNVDGGEGEHAHQQEIANDDEDAAIHGVVAKARAAAGATGSGEMASASSSSLRRNGRKWQILKIDTKMMPKEVEE